MSFINKILARQIKIGVIGLGYVGLPLALAFAEKGFEVLGIDIDKTKIDLLKKGTSDILDVADGSIYKVLMDKTFTVTDKFNKLKTLDVIYICVPTPFTEHKEPDISFILAATKQIAKTLRKNQLIILKSTTFPGTTKDYVLPILESTGLQVGKDFFLAFSPERLDPSNKQFTTTNTPIVVGGITKNCLEMACNITSQIVKDVIPVSNTQTAEMEKLLENIYRSVNIALVNELTQVCDRIGSINIWEVIQSASTKPFGFAPFYPGPGVGGHCILIDPYYLSWLAKKYDLHINFIDLANSVNERMPYYVKDMTLQEINKTGKHIKDVKILVLGAAFKKDVNDIRHSPAIKIMELLIKSGVKKLTYNDPYVSKINICGINYTSTPLSPAVMKKMDCIIIATDHSVFNYKDILKYSKKIIDTRNAIKSRDKKIILLGNQNGLL